MPRKSTKNPPNPWSEHHVDCGPDVLGDPPPARLEILEEECKSALSRNDSPVLVMAARWIVIGTGGFVHNAAMRADHQRQPISAGWTVGAKENTGTLVGALAGGLIGSQFGAGPASASRPGLRARRSAA